MQTQQSVVNRNLPDLVGDVLSKNHIDILTFCVPDGQLVVIERFEIRGNQISLSWFRFR